MNKDMVFSLALLAAGILITILGYILYRKKKRLLKSSGPDKKLSRGKTLGIAVMVLGIWLFIIKLLPLLFGAEAGGGFHVSISPERYMLWGYSISSTVVITWAAMGLVLTLAVLARIFVIPRMKDTPRGIQNALEIAVDGISHYTSDKAGKLGENLSAYLFSVAALLIACAAVELFGVRAPTADITMTLALSIITFILINYYGIRQKGVKGRLKSLASPTPIVFPIRIISDIAIPVSLACRLFGNMLGGMIVMDLLYSFLGSAGLGIPSVIGLYFNVFHPLIQTFIFITLTLTFINEAAQAAD